MRVHLRLEDQVANGYYPKAHKTTPCWICFPYWAERRSQPAVLKECPAVRLERAATLGLHFVWCGLRRERLGLQSKQGKLPP